LGFGCLWLAQALWPVPFSLPGLFLNFLKIGVILFGSGYVLLAYLQTNFMQSLGWLTDRQLIDAIAIGQVIPVPFSQLQLSLGICSAEFPERSWGSQASSCLGWFLWRPPAC